MTLATIYAPNDHQDIFIRRILVKLMDFMEGPLILGGDFNVPLTPQVDTSSGKSSVSISSHKRINQAIHNAQLIDVWRLQHSGERDYSFYSPPHKVYSRIDFFLIPHAQLHAVRETSIGSITWSDHAPISMTYALSQVASHATRMWKLNESLLQIPEVVSEITKELPLYFQTNQTPDSNPGIVWEAHKTVIRGIFIKHGSRIKRDKERQLNLLLTKLQATESKHKNIPSQVIERELVEIRTQINDLLQYRAKAALQKCRKTSYAYGDKCGKILAKLTKEQRLQSYIPHIMSSKDQRIALPMEISKAFRDFYASLYKIPSVTNPQTLIDEYVQSAQIPTITPEIKMELDKPISLEELTSAVNSTKPGKAPGPDGLTLQYYRTLLPILGPFMVDLFNGLGNDETLPRDMSKAYISVIPKEGKDPTLCGSYRPISLLNSDIKLFTKILATRLAIHLPDLVHLDQVGFVPTREARDNTTKVLNLLHVAKTSHTPCVFLSTDAEKAFDRVNWQYMFTVLRYVGLGDTIIQWITTIYSQPTAQVKVNGVLSDPFPILNGTRQGCPLSPVLFVLCLEPFLNRIRRNPDIQGISVGGDQYKISAYADDMLFSLTNPAISLPNLLREFETYGRLSNLEINFHKSEAIGIGIPLSMLSTFKSSFKFKWTATALQYLGTYIPTETSRIFEMNFPSLLSKTRMLLETWNRGLYSWFGRISLLKMSILPKFLYLLQALPIRIPISYLKQVNALFIKFVWAYKKPRFSFHLMTLPKQHGGLAFPDIRAYYQAIHIGRIVDWCRHSRSKLWALIEQAQTCIPLSKALWCYDHLQPPLKSHPLIGTTLRIGSVASKQYSLSSSDSPLFPILGNPQFSPGLCLHTFGKLRRTGITQASHFLVNGRWPSIKELMTEEGPFKLTLWPALQLRHFLDTIPNPRNFTRSLTRFEEYCSDEGNITRVLSKIYTMLNYPTTLSHPSFLEKWEQDLQRKFTPAQTQNIFRLAWKTSICTKTQESNYKLLTRWYYTPYLLHQYYPDTTDICWRCLGDRGTLLHIFWSCPKLTNFWTTVREVSQKFTEYKIPGDPAFFLLHVSNIPAKCYQESILGHLLNAAKSCIPLYWKKQSSPTAADWLRKVIDISRMEDLLAAERNQQDKYFMTWSGWKQFINSTEGIALRR